ncbi:MAG: hypothetical protein VYE68_16385 [Acidobacteriota bacterium]|nr:hypothetical protein [Acidobacteriota bacterium]
MSRVGVMVIGTGLLAAWLSSAASTTSSGQAPNGLPIGGGAQPITALPDTGLIALDQEVARLTARLDAAPRPRTPSRNPFSLVARGVMPSPRNVSPAVPGFVPATPSPVAAATAPTVTLAGIAVDRTPVGRRRTAILSAEGRVVLAHVGDEVIGRYQVRLIDEDTVELLDLQTRTPLRLMLP